MCAQVAATFSIESWEESTLAEVAKGATLKQAVVTKKYLGQLEGSGDVVYQMLYSPKGAAVFVGYEIVTGKLDGKSGSFVFEHRGSYEDGTVKSVWTVVPGSASGKLTGLQGEVAFVSGHQEEYEIGFDYDFE